MTSDTDAAREKAERDEIALDRISTLITSRDHIEAMITQRVIEARAADIPWQAIADTLGITRQSAWAKYRDATT